MRLIRLEVEGGFLDGLDIAFSEGLNVLIGARGSGKTSVIELLRYCLEIPAVTKNAQRKAEEQARWVLEDGCATLTIEVDGVERVIRRCADQEAEGSAPPARGILFVSQKEIEAIGLDGASRRRILDDLAAELPTGESDDADIDGIARRVFAEQQELDEVLEGLGGLEAVAEELKAAEGEQSAADGVGEELGELQDAAKGVSAEIGTLLQRVEEFESVRTRLEDWREELDAARSAEPDLSRAPQEFKAEIEPTLVEVRKVLDSSLVDLTELAAKAEELGHKADIELGAKRRKLAELSAKIEAIEEGAGKVARRIAALREQDEKRRSLLKRQGTLEKRIAELRQARSQALDRLAERGEDRFKARSAAAESINKRFGGEIEVEVVKAGEVGDYEAALGRALEGSGLQWRSLAEQIADRMSPRELIDAVEQHDVEKIVSAGAISETRAQRLAGHLAGVDTTEILLASIDEEVDFSLLDGKERKSTARLSLGQRCTVVLPLLLTRDPDLAVLDQPEDHLDNAFIVDTVVDSLRDRRSDAQVLVATHNANIPVLAEADQVIHLSSSGSRAFVAEADVLDKPEIIDAITRLMEGGEAAFKRRAEFYAR